MEAALRAHEGWTERPEQSCAYRLDFASGGERVVVKQYTNGTLLLTGSGAPGALLDRLAATASGAGATPVAVGKPASGTGAAGRAGPRGGRAAGWTSPARSTPPGSGATSPGRGTTSAPWWPAPSTSTSASWRSWRRWGCGTASASRTPRTGAWPGRCGPSRPGVRRGAGAPGALQRPLRAVPAGGEEPQHPAGVGARAGGAGGARARPLRQPDRRPVRRRPLHHLAPRQGSGRDLGAPGRRDGRDGTSTSCRCPGRKPTWRSQRPRCWPATASWAGWSGRAGSWAGPSPKGPPPRWRPSPGSSWRRTAGRPWGGWPSCTSRPPSAC